LAVGAQIIGSRCSTSASRSAGLDSQGWPRYAAYGDDAGSAMGTVAEPSDARFVKPEVLRPIANVNVVRCCQYAGSREDGICAFSSESRSVLQ
jgi:hypothetical protein